MTQLNDDGERFLPGRMEGTIALEHLHRYLFAMQFAKGLAVLDIASGEGYGTAMLAAQAAQAFGVDIDPRAIASASEKYKSDNLEFRVGECAQIPLADSTVDLVVSFETIEHHDQHEQMMREVKRVLRSDGVLVISSPDKLEYSDKPGWQNPFHVKELYAEEFESLLKANFRHVTLLRQRVLAGSMVLHDTKNPPLQFFRSAEGLHAAERLPAAPYLLAVASDRKLPIVNGGVLEEDVSRLASSLVREANVRTTSLVKALAAPGSEALRRRLDQAWYLEHNPDLGSEGLDRYSHWVDNGASEGRVPSDDLAALALELVAEHLESGAAALAAAEHRLAIGQAALSDSAQREALLITRHTDALGELLAERKDAVERERRWAELRASDETEQRAERARLLQHLQDREHALDNELHVLRTRLDERTQAWDAHEARLVARLQEVETEARSAMESQLAIAARREREFGEQAAQSLRGFEAERAHWASASAAREHALSEQLKSLIQDVSARRDEVAREFTRREDALRVKLDAAEQAARDSLVRMASLATEAAHERDAMHQAHAVALKLMQDRVADIESSTSWRWTAPFRAFVAVFKRSPRPATVGASKPETESPSSATGAGRAEH